jgi:two-component system sensor histidine kinase/response regulator
VALEDNKFIRTTFKSEKEIHVALGFLLGVLISVVITLVEGIASLEQLSWSGLWQVHLTTPACWVADISPILIAFYSWYGGRKIDNAHIDAVQANERYQQMSSLREMAEASSRSKSEFLANMSHEIRTPMNAIIGMNYLMGRTQLSDKQGEYHKKIEVSAKNLLRIIDDILDFSKIEAGKLTLENAPISIAEIISEVADAVNVKLQNKSDVEFVTYVDHTLPRFVLGDSVRLRQVLLNLTDNAAKFTEHGEIRVMARCIKALPYGTIVNFSIKDSGIGISESQLKNLFNPFQQADLSTTRRYGGTGLGLTICRKIVEMMDGELTAASEPGQGSEFSFNAFFSHAEAPETSRPLPTYGLNALLVDDSESARMVLTEMLETLGFNLMVAKDAPEAKRMWDESAQQGKEISLLVVDWKMPGMTGLELVREIKDEDQGKVPSVVMVTSHGAEAVRDALNKNLVDGLLIKPIGISTLNDTIADVLKIEEAKTLRKSSPEDLMGLYRKHLNGTKVLLVEDNEINRDLATELLEEAGVHVDCAFNGLMGVEMAGAVEYDAILMDIQMPEMDGIAATIKIRESAIHEGRPIIAMTAHAIKGEYEKSIAAGMNDHITKPIDPGILYRTLIRFVKGVELDAKYAAATKPSAQSKSIKIKGLAYDDGLSRIGGKVDSYHNLLLRFASRYMNVMTDVRTMVMEGKLAELSAYFHTLAGVSGNVAATDVYELAQRLSVQLKASVDNGETKIRVDLISQMQVLTTRLDELTTLIKDQIRVAKTATVKAEEVVFDGSAVLPLLRKAIEDSDPDAQVHIEQWLKHASGSNQEILQRVSDAISEFEFDKAKEALEELSNS